MEANNTIQTIKAHASRLRLCNLGSRIEQDLHIAQQNKPTYSDGKSRAE